MDLDADRREAGRSGVGRAGSIAFPVPYMPAPSRARTRAMEHRMTTAAAKPIRRARESPLDSLVFDLVEWVEKEPRTYAQAMEAWRTSCPRLAVWEEAVDRGYLVRHRDQAGRARVRVTAAGRAFLMLRARAMRVGPG